jgi:iron complex outermembrane receptor protein
MRRESFGANAGLSLSKDVELYAFGTAAHRTGGSFQNYRLPTKLPQIYPNGFSPVETSNETDAALTAGIKGTDLAGWRWDLSASYGTDNVKIGMVGSANVDLYAATGTTPTSFHLAQYKNTQQGANADLARSFDTGVLPAALSVALGAEARRETYEVGAGDNASWFGSGAQALPGLSPVSAGKHSRNIGAAYLDLSTKLTSQWEAELAGRYEHYSDAGSSRNAKVSTRYEFNPRFAARATASTGFRAPSLAQANYSSLAVSPTTAGGQLAVNSDAARKLGALALRPEKSRSLNLGLVAEPIDNLHVTVDAYRILIRDRIVQGGTYTGQAAIDALTAAGISLPGGLSSVSASYYANGVDTRTQGVDLVAGYPTNLGAAGRVDWDLSANVNTSKVTKVANDGNGNTLLNGQQVGYLTTATPKNKLIVGGVWTLDDWSVSLHATRYGKTATEATFYSGPNIYSNTVFNHIENKPKTLTDLEVRYAVTKKLQLAAGATNLFDVYPTKVPAISRYLGVYQYDTAAAQIPFNGGYYYVRANYKF